MLATATSFSSSNFSPEDYVYNSVTTSSDSNAVDTKDADEDDGPQFGFGFDLEIDSFTKPPMEGLAPSSRVKPSSTPKPLHYSSFVSPSPSLTLPEDTPSAHLRRLKTPGGKKKPLIPVVSQNPMERAAERRYKRDAKRDDVRSPLAVVVHSDCLKCGCGTQSPRDLADIGIQVESGITIQILTPRLTPHTIATEKLLFRDIRTLPAHQKKICCDGQSTWSTTRTSYHSR